MTETPGGAAGLPHLIPWNVTPGCPQKCSHCYMAAGDNQAESALTPEEATSVIDQIRATGKPFVVMSGGESLFREEIRKIARYCTEQVLRYPVVHAVLQPGGVGPVTAITGNIASSSAVGQNAGLRTSGTFAGPQSTITTGSTRSVLHDPKDAEAVTGTSGLAGATGPVQYVPVTFLILAPAKDGICLPEVRIDIYGGGSVRQPVPVNLTSGSPFRNNRHRPCPGPCRGALAQGGLWINRVFVEEFSSVLIQHLPETHGGCLPFHEMAAGADSLKASKRMSSPAGCSRRGVAVSPLNMKKRFPGAAGRMFLYNLDGMGL